MRNFAWVEARIDRATALLGLNQLKGRFKGAKVRLATSGRPMAPMAVYLVSENKSLDATAWEKRVHEVFSIVKQTLGLQTKMQVYCGSMDEKPKTL